MAGLAKVSPGQRLGIPAGDYRHAILPFDDFNWDVLLKLPCPLAEIGSVIVPLDQALNVTEFDFFSSTEFMSATVTATAVVEDYDPANASWDSIDGLQERMLQAFTIQTIGDEKCIFALESTQNRHYGSSTPTRLQSTRYCSDTSRLGSQFYQDSTSASYTLMGSAGLDGTARVSPGPLSLPWMSPPTIEQSWMATYHSGLSMSGKIALSTWRGK